MARSTTPRRRGPKGAAVDARADLLRAARQEFGSRGYRGTTVRAVASRAGVDPALVSHYFGNKEGLFRAALTVDVDISELVAGVLSGPRDQIGDHIVRQFFTLYDGTEFRASVLAMLRTAMTDPDTAGIMRAMIQERAAPALATAARGPDPTRQVMLAMTQLIGVVLGRHVVGLDPLRSADIDELAAELGPVVQRYFDGTHTDVTRRGPQL